MVPTDALEPLKTPNLNSKPSGMSRETHQDKHPAIVWETLDYECGPALDTHPRVRLPNGYGEVKSSITYVSQIHNGTQCTNDTNHDS